MRILRAAGAVLTAAAIVAVGSSGAAALAAYKWKKRPLVVFAGGAGDASLAAQRAIVAASRGGFVERDMVVVYVVGNVVHSDRGDESGMSAAGLRARFRVGDGAFQVVLVGKDGGAKLSSAAPLAANTVFGTIDAMPMRQQEMRGK